MNIGSINLVAINQTTINKLFSKGETVEARVISKDSTGAFLLKIKNEVFQAIIDLAPHEKNIPQNMKLKITALQPIPTLTDEKGTTVRLTALLPKTKATTASKKPDTQPLKTETKNINLQIRVKDPLNLRPGEVVKAIVLSKKSPTTYIVKLGEKLVEAFSNVEIKPSKDPVNLLVEKVKPHLTLRIIEKSSKPVEFAKSSLAIEEHEPKINEALKLTEQLQMHTEQKSIKDALINTQKLLNALKEIRYDLHEKAGTIKWLISLLETENSQNKQTETKLKMAAKNSYPETESAENRSNQPLKSTSKDTGIIKSNKIDSTPEKNFKTPPSKADRVTQETKKSTESQRNIAAEPEKINKTTGKETSENHIRPNTVKKTNGNNLYSTKNQKEKVKTVLYEKTKSGPVETAIDKEINNLIKKLAPIISSLSLQSSTNQQVPPGQISFLESLSESLESILNNIIQLKNDIENIESSLVSGNLQEAKKTASNLRAAIKEIAQFYQKIESKNTEVDTETIKNAIKQAKTPNPTMNLFVQIVVNFKNQKGHLYIQKEAKKEHSGKKAYNIKLISNTSPLGLFELSATYYDGLIHCNIGFESKETLKRFEKQAESLKTQLKNTTIRSFLLKKKPIFIKKGFDIEA